MRVLITGGAGYLGSVLAERLGEDSVVYDNLLYLDEFLASVQFVQGDVTNCTQLKTALARADYVVWLAAKVGDAPCNVNPSCAFAVNVDAVRCLVENYDGPIVFTSSASVYGANESEAVEGNDLAPQSLYAETKIQAEEILACTDRALILRLGTLHGASPRMRFDLVVNSLTMQAMTRNHIKVFGGQQWRPLLHVQDAADFIARAIWRTETGEPWRTGIYNLATENHQVSTIANILARLYPSLEVETVPSVYEDKRDYRLNCTKAKLEFRDVFFKNYRDIEVSMKEIEELIRSGRIKNPYHHRYANLASLTDRLRRKE